MGMVGLRDVLVVAPAASFHRHHDTLLPPASADLHPVIPLLAAIDADANARPTKPAPTGIHFWQPQLQAQNPNPNPNPSMPYLRSAAGILAGGGTATCQDCGNQAKKDCVHHRCRTCCKSRGFDCSTHVKSTWVPAARRRERQQLSAAAATGGSSASASTSAPKKPRLVSSQATNSHTSTSNTTPPRSFDTTSSHQDASFREGLPGQVRAPAVFKCVRVTSIDDGEDEFAYQAMVRIGGHVFKGFLYDQGVDDGRGGEQAHDSNSNNNAIPNISELHLGAAAHNATTSSLPGSAGPSDIFGGGGTLLGGTSYGNPMN